MSLLIGFPLLFILRKDPFGLIKIFLILINTRPIDNQLISNDTNPEAELPSNPESPETLPPRSRKESTASALISDLTYRSRKLSHMKPCFCRNSPEPFCL